MKYYKLLLLIFFGFLFSFNSLFAQEDAYKKLINIAIKQGQFIYTTPLSLYIDSFWIEDYIQYLESTSGVLVDISVLAEIVANSKKSDTTDWTDDELEKFILVKDKSEYVSLKYIIRKFDLKNRKLKRYYKQFLEKYNNTKTTERPIYSYSKPVFDNSGKYAIVQWFYPGFGGGITLFQFENNKWVEIGNFEVTRI